MNQYEILELLGRGMLCVLLDKAKERLLLICPPGTYGDVYRCEFLFTLICLLTESRAKVKRTGDLVRNFVHPNFQSFCFSHFAKDHDSMRFCCY
jgi:hypothetical protein